MLRRSQGMAQRDHRRVRPVRPGCKLMVMPLAWHLHGRLPGNQPRAWRNPRPRQGVCAAVHVLVSARKASKAVVAARGALFDGCGRRRLGDAENPAASSGRPTAARNSGRHSAGGLAGGRARLPSAPSSAGQRRAGGSPAVGVEGVGAIPGAHAHSITATDSGHPVWMADRATATVLSERRSVAPTSAGRAAQVDYGTRCAAYGGDAGSGQIAFLLADMLYSSRFDTLARRAIASGADSRHSRAGTAQPKAALTSRSRRGRPAASPDAPISVSDICHNIASCHGTESTISSSPSRYLELPNLEDSHANLRCRAILATLPVAHRSWRETLTITSPWCGAAPTARCAPAGNDKPKPAFRLFQWPRCRRARPPRRRRTSRSSIENLAPPLCVAAVP